MHAPIEAKATGNPDDADATRPNGASPNTRSGKGSKLIACPATSIENDRTTSSAGPQSPSPACDAVTAHSPAPVNVTIDPSTVHAPSTLNDTTNPDDADATNSNGTSPNTRSGKGSKLIA